MSAVTVNGREYDGRMLVGETTTGSVMHALRSPSTFGGSEAGTRCGVTAIIWWELRRDTGAIPCSRCFPVDGGETR